MCPGFRVSSLGLADLADLADPVDFADPASQPGERHVELP